MIIVDEILRNKAQELLAEFASCIRNQTIAECSKIAREAIGAKPREIADAIDAL